MQTKCKQDARQPLQNKAAIPNVSTKEQRAQLKGINYGAGGTNHVIELHVRNSLRQIKKLDHVISQFNKAYKCRP